MSQQTANLIEIRGMYFTRGNRPIFADINLAVPKGKVTAIMGPSGIGKTTLLRLIGGQLRLNGERSGLMAIIFLLYPVLVCMLPVRR